MRFSTVASVSTLLLANSVFASPVKRDYGMDTVTVYETHYHTVYDNTPEPTPSPAADYDNADDDNMVYVTETHYYTEGAVADAAAVETIYYTSTEGAYTPAPAVETIYYTSTEGAYNSAPAEPTTRTKHHHKKPAVVKAPVAQSSAVSAPSTDTTGLDDFQATILKRHNELRALHGANPLTWSSELANYAEGTANLQGCKFEHTNSPYGENLAAGTASGFGALQAVNMWYNECAATSYTSGSGYLDKAGHYTQVVWAATTELGCAIKKGCDNGLGNYIMCEYRTAGNVVGGDNGNQYFKENVKGQCTTV